MQKRSDSSGAFNILFLLPVAGQPRYWKRIKGLRGAGATTRVLAFHRPYVPLGSGVDEDVEILGVLQDGHYLRRLIRFLRALPAVLRSSRHADVVYCFGADVAVLGWLVRLIRPRIRVVMEAGDVRGVMVRGRGATVLRALERLLLRGVELVVTTSTGFRDEYFVGIQSVPAERIAVIENKVDDDVVHMARTLPASAHCGAPVVIGYYGLIRCRRSWEVLRRLADSAPDRFRVVVWGRLALDDDVQADRVPSAMSYRGAYRYPDDLAKIYREIDVVWVAHAHGETNRRWARANRFYDACCFGRPLIGQTDTLDGMEIERLGIGQCIELREPDIALASLLAISQADLAIWTHRARALDPATYMYTVEHESILRRLRSQRETTASQRPAAITRPRT